MTRKIILIILSTISVHVACASEINDIARKIVDQDPSMAAIAARYNAELLDGRDRNQLEAPEIEVEHLFAGGDARDKTGVTVSQSFDWPGAYGARAKALNASSSAMECLRRSDYLDKVLSTKLTLLEVIYTSKRLELVDSMEANISRMLADTERGFHSGIYTILDVNRMRIECADMKARKSALNVRLAELKADIESMAPGLDADDIISSIDAYPIEIMRPREEYLSSLEDSDPALAAARASAESGRLAVKAEKLSRLPGWSLSYKYSKEEGINFNGFSVGITLPFLRRNYAGKSARMLQDAASLDYEAILAAREAEVRSLFDRAERLSEINRMYSEVFDKSNNMRLLQKAYSGGQMSSVEYLNDVNYFLNAHESYLENLYMYAVTLATLNKYELL